MYCEVILQDKYRRSPIALNSYLKSSYGGRTVVTIRVAVVGGGPAGASAAEVLAKAGIETYLFERKLDNVKPCGGAIPLCMISEFDIPRNHR